MHAHTHAHTRARARAHTHTPECAQSVVGKRRPARQHAQDGGHHVQHGHRVLPEQLEKHALAVAAHAHGGGAHGDAVEGGGDQPQQVLGGHQH